MNKTDMPYSPRNNINPLIFSLKQTLWWVYKEVLFLKEQRWINWSKGSTWWAWRLKTTHHYKFYSSSLLQKKTKNLLISIYQHSWDRCGCFFLLFLLFYKSAISFRINFAHKNYMTFWYKLCLIWPNTTVP